MSRSDRGGCTKLLAPAKINFGLRIVGRRGDGMHLLESLVLPLDLADEVRLEARSGHPRIDVSLVLERPDDAPPPSLSGLPADRSNLAARAARLFLERAGLAAEVRITLRKRIPSAAGLGGGSSDAGATLRGMAELFPGALSRLALCELALALGADVPFFLAPRPAWMRGVGERIQPLEGSLELALVLANSGDSLSTAAVYELFDRLAPALTSPGPGSTMRTVSALGGQLDDAERRRRLRGMAHNDLEVAAMRLCPAAGHLKRRLLDSGALAAGMSGSGATVFGVFVSPQAARAVQARMAACGQSVWARVAVAPGAR